jgi:CO/xanthine dehydrogenase Mo-binding subunit
MRGFGAVQACFGIESTVDLLAEKLSFDPVELRRRNVLVEGDAFPTSGQRFTDQTDLRDLIDRCMALPIPSVPTAIDLDTPGGTGRTLMGAGIARGEGFALGVKNHLYGEGVPENSWARLTREGDTIIVESSASECGQGIQGVLDRIVRTEFPECDVRFAVPSTWMEYSGSSSASRQSWMSGSAVLGAARRLKSVDSKDGSATSAEFEYRAVATYRGDPTNGTGDIHVSWMFVAHRASVEVDPELGLVRVAAIATAQDVGRIINATEVRGQILGGIAQGVGFAINEHLDTPNGLAVNNSLTDYLVLTAADMPIVKIDIVEQPDPRNPLGIKGVGEPSAISSTAAIANAIRRATGRVITRIPVRPSDIARGV